MISQQQAAGYNAKFSSLNITAVTLANWVFVSIALVTDRDFHIVVPIVDWEPEYFVPLGILSICISSEYRSSLAQPPERRSGRSWGWSSTYLEFITHWMGILASCHCMYAWIEHTQNDAINSQDEIDRPQVRPWWSRSYNAAFSRLIGMLEQMMERIITDTGPNRHHARTLVRASPEPVGTARDDAVR